MPIFTIRATDSSGLIKVFLYNNETSSLTDERGVSVVPEHVRPDDQEQNNWRQADTTMLGKTSKIKRLKIQLGLSCNYSCEYCSQRFVPHSEETNKNDIEPFLTKLPQWFDGGDDGKGSGVRIEFWGGEPLVYWKTLKPLAEALRQKYPNAEFMMITNGSLLDLAKNEWLDKLGFCIAVSHDGPGQYVRGPDPLEDPKQKEAILDLYRRLSDKGRFSFNATINSENQSRAAIRDFFVELTGNESVQIGEGAFIESYDEGGLSKMLDSQSEIKSFMNLAFTEIATEKATMMNNGILGAKIDGFIESIRRGRPSSALGQKCGMDMKENIAVDLRGNVLTCHNVSAVGTAPNGESHKVGSVDDLESVNLKTSKHWSKRENCWKCPVLQLCGGSCMFLDGKLFDASCDSSFADNMVFFTYAFELMTGFRPFLIEGGLKARELIWNPKPLSMRVIPIVAT